MLLTVIEKVGDAERTMIATVKWVDVPERVKALFKNGNNVQLENIAEARELGLQDDDIDWFDTETSASSFEEVAEGDVFYSDIEQNTGEMNTRPECDYFLFFRF